MNFFKRWKDGMMNLTPEQQLQAQVTGHGGTTIGVTLALIVMLYKGLWYWGVFIFFIGWLQVVSYIGAKQKLKNTRKMMSEVNTIQSEELLRKLGGN